MKTLMTRWCRVVVANALVYHQRNERDAVVVVDKLTYAGNLMSLAPVAQSERFAFVSKLICNPASRTRIR